MAHFHIDYQVDVIAGNDDTFSVSGTQNLNSVTAQYIRFGDKSSPPANSYKGFIRYNVNLSKEAIIIDARLVFTAYGNHSGVMDRHIHALTMTAGQAWRGANGFAVANYSNGVALNAIPFIPDLVVVWDPVDSMITDTVYESPNIRVLVQEQIQDANYDPAVNGYIGFCLDTRTYNPGPDTYRDVDSGNIPIGVSPELHIVYGMPHGPSTTEPPQCICWWLPTGQSPFIMPRRFAMWHR